MTKQEVCFAILSDDSPYHIDTYHHLGIIETDLGHLRRALKYFEMGCRIGLLSIPNDFAGNLPWSRLKNRPFLRAAHGYGLALERQRRHLEAVDVYEQILSLNPGDNQGVRYLLPSLYLAAKFPQKGERCNRDVQPTDFDAAVWPNG